MNDVLNFLFGLAMLIFSAYVVIFGGIGALLSRHRGGSLVAGFILGLIPIFGWPIVLWITRSAKRRISADEWLGPERSGQLPSPGPVQTFDASPRGSPPSETDPHDY